MSNLKKKTKHKLLYKLIYDKLSYIKIIIYILLPGAIGFILGSLAVLRGYLLFPEYRDLDWGYFFHILYPKVTYAFFISCILSIFGYIWYFILMNLLLFIFRIRLSLLIYIIIISLIIFRSLYFIFIYQW